MFIDTILRFSNKSLVLSLKILQVYLFFWLVSFFVIHMLVAVCTFLSVVFRYCCSLRSHRRRQRLCISFILCVCVCLFHSIYVFLFNSSAITHSDVCKVKVLWNSFDALRPYADIYKRNVKKRHHLLSLLRRTVLIDIENFFFYSFFLCLPSLYYWVSSSRRRQVSRIWSTSLAWILEIIEESSW